MAKIVEERIVIKFSKLVKGDDSDTSPTINVENALALEQVAQELVGPGVVVEVEAIE